jgi:hypothetical protein
MQSRDCRREKSSVGITTFITDFVYKNDVAEIDIDLVALIFKILFY